MTFFLTLNPSKSELIYKHFFFVYFLFIFGLDLVLKQRKKWVDLLGNRSWELLCLEFWTFGRLLLKLKFITKDVCVVDIDETVISSSFMCVRKKNALYDLNSVNQFAGNFIHSQISLICFLFNLQIVCATIQILWWFFFFRKKKTKLTNI